MAFETGDMNERRQHREQRQKARLEKERKTRFRLLIAAGVLVLVAVVVLALSLGRKPGQTEQTHQTTLPVQTSPAPEQETQEASRQFSVIRFAAAGDLNITDDVVAAGGSTYDYTAAFMDVLPLLAEADLTALNFEGNVCGAPYGKDSAPQQLLTALKAAGVDMLQVANSKSISRGVAGLNSTVQNIRAAGMACVGAVPEGEKSGAYVIRYVQGVKVAVVAFTKGMDGMAMPEGSEGLVNLLYTDYSTTYKKVDTKGITKVLRAVEAEEPDITIALLHWGSEYSDIRGDTQSTIRDLMFKEGVDAIIGTHPHYVQEIEFNAEKGTLVAYSLGDFFGDASRSGTAYSIVLELEITKDNINGITKITNYKFTPIYTVRDDTGFLRVVRLREAISAYKAGRVGRVSEETYTQMVYGLDRIRERIKVPEETE